MLNGSGTPAHDAVAQVNEVNVHPRAFDVDDGALKTKPKTLIGIMAGLFVIGGMVAVALYRLNSMEATIADIPNQIEQRIIASEDRSDQARKIACLQQQIANKNWTCPDAVAKAPEPVQPARRAVARRKVETSVFGWPSAQAGQ